MAKEIKIFKFINSNCTRKTGSNAENMNHLMKFLTSQKKMVNGSVVRRKC